MSKTNKINENLVRIKKDIKDIRIYNDIKDMNKKIINARRGINMFNKMSCGDEGFIEVEGIEQPYKITQKDIKEKIDINSGQKGYELELKTFGPYIFDYTRNGRCVLLGGKKGHIGGFEWKKGVLNTEINVNENIMDVKWLHNEKLFVAAQKKYVYMYDNKGIEVHCLKRHIEVLYMEFLPYHYLLATIGRAGYLKYQDISTGRIIAEYSTGAGMPKAMVQNRYNAIIHVGHYNGTVSLWSPNLSTPLVKILSHRGPITGLSIDREGRYMVSSGADSQVKIWDIRNWKEVHSYFSRIPASTLDISDTGMLAIGWGSHISFWKDALRKKQKSPYLTHLNPGSAIKRVRFCPYEDVLGFSHMKGFSSLIVPGSGEPSYDAYEINPYETKKQRREKEVRSLLEKLHPEMIVLDPDYIGKVDTTPSTSKENDSIKESKPPEQKWVPKPKTRGKNSALRRYLRKRAKNIIDDRKLRIQASLDKEKKLRQIHLRKRLNLPLEKPLGPALERFNSKKNIYSYK